MNQITLPKTIAYSAVKQIHNSKNCLSDWEILKKLILKSKGKTDSVKLINSERSR
jgi:hypothetical protein